MIDCGSAPDAERQSVAGSPSTAREASSVPWELVAVAVIRPAGTHCEAGSDITFTGVEASTRSPSW